MKIIKFDNEEEWLESRKGKITGSKLKDIVAKRGTGKKIGFYELIADRLSVQGEPENVMDRGHRLEGEAIDLFSEIIGKKIDKSLSILLSDNNSQIACSPDGIIDEKEMVEIKCLSASRHLQAYFEKTIPDEYEFQKLQYFIVNEDLQVLYFVFYDPRVTAMPLHFIEVTRESVKEDIKTYLEYQQNVLKEVEELTASLAY